MQNIGLVLTCLLLRVFASTAGPLQLKLLEDSVAKSRGAQCLDHSPAGYYIREQDPKKWIIFLEGGGLCVEPIDCWARRKMSLGSSSYWTPTKQGNGLGTLSLAETNPFANWSHVFVPYCSGDTWLGTSAKEHIALFGLQMSGHLIIETVVERILNTTNLVSATDIVFSGSSAGGIGVFHHTDWFVDTVTSRAHGQNLPQPRITGLPIEGMFFPEKFPVEFEQYVIGSRTPLDGFMSHYLHLLQDPWLLPACTNASAHQGFAKSLCFDVSKMLPYTKTPLFILQNRFDKLQIQDIGLCFSCKEGDAPTSWSGGYTRFYGACQNQTLVDIKSTLPHLGFFVPSAFHHDENFYDFFDGVVKVISGTSMRDAFQSWYWDRASVTLVEPTCNQDGPCPGPSSVELALSSTVVVV